MANNVIQAPNMAYVAPDIQAQQVALQRQQQLADMLRQQSITPIETGQMVTGAGPARAVPVTGMQALAKILQAGMGGYMQRQNDAKGLELGQQMNQRLGTMNDQTLPPLATDGQPAQPAQQDPQSAALVAALQGSPRTMSDGSQVPNRGPTNEAAAAMDNFTADPSQMPQPVAQAAPPPDMAAALRSAVKNARLMGNNDLANKLTEQAWSAYAPTDATKMANAAGGDAVQANRDAQFKANYIAPVANRGSGVLTMNPKTHQLENDPASMEGIRNAKQYDNPITLKTSTGQEVQLSPTEWADYQGNGGKLPARFLSPGKLDAIQSDVNKSGTPADINFSTPQGQVGGHITPSGVGQIGVSQTPFNQALDKDEAGRVSKMTEDIYDKGTHALDKVAQNNKMIELLPQVTTGPLNKQITMLRNAAQSLGVDVGDPAPNQEFDKYAIQGALSAAKSIYGSRITNMDVETQIKSNPGATMGEKAIYQMLKWDNEARQREIQKMTAYGEYKRGGGDPREFPVFFAQKYPYEGVSAPENGKSQEYKVSTPAAPSQAKPVKNSRPPLDSLIQVH